MATVMATWGEMVVGVDELQNNIPERHEEATEVMLASKRAALALDVKPQSTNRILVLWKVAEKDERRVLFTRTRVLFCEQLRPC